VVVIDVRNRGRLADVTMLDRVRTRALTWAREQAAEYSGDEPRPLGGYVALMSVYGAATLGAAAASRALHRPAPRRIGPWDVVQLIVATHRVSRTISKDPVTSPLRAPFMQYAGLQAAGELHEEVRGNGWQHSAGELLGCPMCLAQWVATALCAGLVLAPVPTRLVLATMTAVGGADFLQQLYSLLEQASES
jgi:hypothetical protein